jgi:transcriptional regulator with PAS, ATPase and Fis domain
MRVEHQLIGTSAAIDAIREDITAAARTDAKVLITGETGAGKEVIARRIHAESARRSAPLTTLNCAGLPDSLLESELFGHVRGSFTGAYRDKPGLLELASSGTVFLDEVGEMSTRMQGVLLRFLETGELQRVGADRVHARANVRVIAATNRDLSAEVGAGNFREDLYYRLNVIRICVPPLRERREDIPALVEYMIDLCSREARMPRPTISTTAMDVLVAYRWPGNVRELKNVIERMMLRVSGRPIGPDDIPSDILATRQPVAVQAGPAMPVEIDAATELVNRMLKEGVSFWSAVYPAFMQRDLTRESLRRIIGQGLQRSAGNYRLVVELFNMPPGDYKRFLSFLRKHDCQVPFRPFRVVPTTEAAAGSERPALPFRRPVAV